MISKTTRSNTSHSALGQGLARSAGTVSAGNVPAQSRNCLSAERFSPITIPERRFSTMSLRCKERRFQPRTYGSSQLRAKSSPPQTLKERDLPATTHGSAAFGSSESAGCLVLRPRLFSWSRFPRWSGTGNARETGRWSRRRLERVGTGSLTTRSSTHFPSTAVRAVNVCSQCGRRHGLLTLRELPQGFWGESVSVENLTDELDNKISAPVSADQVKRFQQFVGGVPRPACWEGMLVLDCLRSRGGAVQVGFSPTIIATGNLCGIDALGRVRTVTTIGHEWLMGLPRGYTQIREEGDNWKEKHLDAERRKMVGEGIVPHVLKLIGRGLEPLLGVRR